MQTRTVTSARRRVVKSGRVVALSAIGLVTAVTVSGCSMDWTSMARLPQTPETASAAGAAATAAPAAHSGGAASARPAEAGKAGQAAASGSTSAVAPAVPGDLATGSATHVLPAGASQLAVDYWTTAAPSQLGSAPTATVQLSAHLEGAGAGTQTRVSRFRAVAPAADGSTSVLVDDAGSFSITAPFSYSTAAQVPTAGVGSSTTVQLQWDLLVETAPRSNVWFRQTVIDQLVIALPAAQSTGQSTGQSAPTASPTSEEHS